MDSINVRPEFKVNPLFIHVDIPEKLVTNGCYDKQYVYVSHFAIALTLDEPTAVK